MYSRILITMYDFCPKKPRTSEKMKFHWKHARNGTFRHCSSLVLKYDPTHDKTSKMAWAPSEDSDHPGHSPSLIRVFVVRSMGSIGTKLSSCGQRWLWSVRMPGLIYLHWAHMSLYLIYIHKCIIFYTLIYVLGNINTLFFDKWTS